MSPEQLAVYAAAFREAHAAARWGLSVEVGTRRGGSAMLFLMLLDQIYNGYEKPHLVTVDPYGCKPYVSGIPGLENIPIYGDPEYLAMKSLLAKFPAHMHFKLCSLDFFQRMHGCPYWSPGVKPFTTPTQPGEFALGEERRMSNLTFCLLDGDHSEKTISAELNHLWRGSDGDLERQRTPWMNPAGIVCVDNVESDPRTIPAIDADYRAVFGSVDGQHKYAIVRGLK